jgi:tetratricopeptide (TPR) repeat protein
VRRSTTRVATSSAGDWNCAVPDAVPASGEQPQALLARASALAREGRRAEAIVLFADALQRDPAAAESWYEFGYLLKAEGRYEEALQAYSEALARGVSRPEEVHLNRAVIYSDNLRRDADAEHELAAALALAPAYVPALLNRGNLHEERGEREQALVCYDRILSGVGADDGRNLELVGEALARSTRLRPPTGVDDPLFRRIEAAAAAAARHSQIRANLLFAMGEAYDRLAAYDQAFDAYTRGNRCLLRQSGRLYERAHAARLTDALIAAFDTPVSAGGDAPPGQAAPLFICGMFRSGSTLVEQVLASHPEVTAGGELDFLMRLAASRFAPFPASMARPDAARDAALADEYRAHLAQLFPDGIAGRYITDKRPDNFQLIGLIKRMFPAAKIVHSVRHPLDTGLSVYLQHINLQVAPYASDLGDIGHYYGEYRRLMAHWKALYGDSIFDFDYDAFVASPRTELERLLAFLGLDFDERCLAFHQLGNTVKTASYWQIRRPLYGNASGRWRNYATHLRPLAQALRESGVDTCEG